MALPPLPLPKSSKVLRTSGGRFDRRPGIFFPALTDGGGKIQGLLNVRELGVRVDRCLIAYNCMPGSNGVKWWENTQGPESIPELRGMIENDGLHFFLDSGVFTFCHDYGRKHNIPGTFVFSFPESEFDPGILQSYEKHYGEYVARIKHLLWGAVEIDLGTLAERKARRARMRENYGVVTIPVYRPECDPFEELEKLMASYDRICLPVTVKFLPAEVRWALVSRIVELQRTKYPYCYLHVLGSAPVHQWASIAMQSGSCDSSSWIAPVRYGTRPTYSLSHSVQTKLKQFEGANPGEVPILFRDLGNPQGLPPSDSINELYLANMGGFLSLNTP